MSDLPKLLIDHVGDLHSPNDPFTVSHSKISGRGIFATRDIRINEVIFRDNPLILVPRVKNSPPLCVCCFATVNAHQLCKQNCTLPLCELCQGASKHRAECDLIVRWQPKNPNELSQKILSSLCAIRGCVLNENGASILNCMQGNLNTRIDNEIEKLVGEFLDFPSTDENLLNQLKHILAVISTNAFETMLGPEDSHSTSLCGLYPLAGLLNHCCFPNTRYSFDQKHVMTVRAIRPIRKDEEIVNSYCKILASTSIRQLILKETKKFTCHCDRCRDATEFGALLCSLKCVDESCTGVLVPNDPLTILSTWTCTGCTLEHQAKKVFMLERVISSYLKSKMDNDTTWRILQFCRADLKSILPVTNQMALEIKSHLIRQIRECDVSADGKSKWSILDLADKETFCLDIISVLEKLGMRESVKAGKLYFELYKCRHEMYKRNGCTKTQQDENENLLQHSWRILSDDVTAPVDLVSRIKERAGNRVD